MAGTAVLTAELKVKNEKLKKLRLRFLGRFF
jgi:hypothetical protein